MGIGAFMKTNSKRKKIIFSCCALVLVVAIVAAIFLPGVMKKDIKNYSYVAKTQKSVDASSGFDVTVVGSGNRKILVNSKNGAVAFVSADGKTIFNACSKDAAEQTLAHIISLRLRDKDGNSYIMNSTDNSVAFGTFGVISQSNTRTNIRFDFYPDAAASKKGFKGAAVYASVTVSLNYEYNNFKASVNTKDIMLPDGFYVEKLSIMPGLFSVSEATGNEFYTLPDGCGSVIDLSAVSEKPLVADLGMYGSDVSFFEYEQGAALPFLAFTKKDCIVNTIIGNGDGLSEISFKRFEKGGGYLYNTFNVTACGMVDGKFVAGEPYEGELSQIYVITQEKGADYNNIAEQVRDNLVSRGYLPREMKDKFVDFPFFVNVLGSADGKTQETTFEDAAEITALLKSRGVRNVALRFSGAGKKGLSSDSDYADTFSKKLGGKAGFSEMAGKIVEQGNSAWLDLNVYTDNSDKKGADVMVYEMPSKFAGFAVEQFSLNSTRKVNNIVSECYNVIADIESTDVCLNDASMVLYTDLSGKNNRQDVLSNMREKSGALNANSSLMLSYPAAYLLSNADAVFSVPDTSMLSNNRGVTAVPIMQMVLHGSLVYGSSYMNVTNLSAEDALLRCVEYGSAPAFLFTHNSQSNLNYNVYASYTAQLYARAKKLLPVMDMKMTSHEVVIDGVYKITYDYSKVVYVNYNPSVVEVNGGMISAKDFVVI